MSWICFGNMNLCIWCQWKPFEHEWEKTWWGSVTRKVCFWVCFVWCFLDRTSKTQQSNKTACSVCIISHTSMHTQRLTHTHSPSAHTHTNTMRHYDTNAANHSSIFYAGMHETSAALCKLQLMCVREETSVEQAENTKVERRSEWEQRQMKKKGSKIQEKIGRKKRLRDRGQILLFLHLILHNHPGYSLFHCAIVAPFSCTFFISFLFIISLHSIFSVIFSQSHHCSSK